MSGVSFCWMKVLHTPAGCRACAMCEESIPAALPGDIVCAVVCDRSGRAELIAVIGECCLTGATAFAALVKLTSQLPNGRQDLRAPFEAKRRRVRDLVTEVARVLGLAEHLKRAAVSTAINDAPKAKSTMTVGSFWDRHPQFQK